MDDIVIIGTGPVGLMLACELSLTGTVLIVLDKRTEPGDLPKANRLGGQIIDLLDHRGLLVRLSVGSPFFGVPPGFPFGPIPLRFAGLDDIPLRMLMIQQPRLERLLGERAAELGVRRLTQQRMAQLDRRDKRPLRRPARRPLADPPGRLRGLGGHRRAHGSDQNLVRAPICRPQIVRTDSSQPREPGGRGPPPADVRDSGALGTGLAMLPAALGIRGVSLFVSARLNTRFGAQAVLRAACC